MCRPDQKFTLSREQEYDLREITHGLETVSAELCSFVSLLNFISDKAEGDQTSPWYALADALRAIEKKLDAKIEDLMDHRNGNIVYPMPEEPEGAL